eukprot:gb/GFBE01012230.1/.p1 GENE.gb/GFBE01012230.1/~~gb/GFBE01012230.1/.p1  ORF type:complete len:439 (+),score=124.90 gb/GFBE01012230.1/:1-1317(+)
MAAFSRLLALFLAVFSVALEALKTQDVGAAVSSGTLRDSMMACTCQCCEVSPRVASLRSDGGTAETQCAPLLIESPGCHAECEDVDLANAATSRSADSVASEEAAFTDYARYCLNNCVPSGAIKQGLSVPCSFSHDASLSGEQAVALAMAKVYAPQLMIEGAEQNKSEPAPTLEESGALVADAEGKKATAMVLEAQSAAAAAEAAADQAKSAYDLQVAQSRGSLAKEVKAQLRESAKRAEAFAQSAKDAAKKAMDELREMQDVPIKAAREAAEAAKRQLKSQDTINDQVMQAVDDNVHPPPVPPPPVAAAKAAEPYSLAMGRAAEMQSSLENKASQLTSEAHLLRTGAKQVEGQLKAYADDGRQDLADQVKASSNDLLMKSMAKDTEAAETRYHAEQVQQDIPKYADAAAAAVARATVIANQKWMPPALEAEHTDNAD